MKRILLPLLTLGAVFTAASLGFAQPKPAAPAPAQAAPKQQKLVKVATLNGVQANKDFQSNLQLVQAQRQGAQALNDELEKEKDPKKKKELKTKLDAAMAKLNENNAAMQKAYGFSLSRNYTMEIETSHIYLLVTDEEAAKIDQEQKAAEQKAKKKK